MAAATADMCSPSAARAKRPCCRTEHPKANAYHRRACYRIRRSRGYQVVRGGTRWCAYQCVARSTRAHQTPDGSPHSAQHGLDTQVPTAAELASESAAREATKWSAVVRSGTRTNALHAPHEANRKLEAFRFEPECARQILTDAPARTPRRSRRSRSSEASCLSCRSCSSPRARRAG
jgi:hypothetical protein